MTELVGSHTASIQKMEMQMSDFSREQNPKQKGTLPSNTIANPNDSGGGPTSHCMAITTRSAKLLPSESERVIGVEDVEQEDEAQVEVPNIVEVERNPKKVKAQDVNHEKVEEKVIGEPKPLAHIPRPPPRFTQRLAKRVDNSKFEKLFDILKQLSVNILVVEAFQEMPSFAKNMKDFITKEKTIKNKMKAGLGMARPMSLRFQMVEHAITRPIGIVDDVLVKVGKFLLATDLVILDYVVDKEIPIILGRPFLAIGRALMDSERSEIKLWVNDEEVTFQASKGIKFPNSYESILVLDIVDVVEDAIEVKMEEECLGEALAVILINYNGEDMEVYMEMMNALEGFGSFTYAPKKLSFELENRSTPPR
nr:uncharacterized protein LOC104118494 [Nicotiana tomentosiformis]